LAGQSLKQGGRVVDQHSRAFIGIDTSKLRNAVALAEEVILSDQPGAQSWPMTAATFILIHKQPQDPVAVGEALKFFAWAYSKGDKMAE
jgi:ABC-type phosphate transport system substrate-binding protein